jgi:hypothetical protein
MGMRGGRAGEEMKGRGVSEERELGEGGQGERGRGRMGRTAI